MKTNILPFVTILFVLVAGSCAPVTQIETGHKTRVSLYAGANKGGITENTDMSVVPDAVAPPEAIVDAFTGATSTGYNAGVHVSRKIRRLEIETGVDYMYNYQSFNYIDAGNFYMGQRDLDVSQFMVPVTLNIPFMNFLLPSSGLMIKLGYVGQLNLVTVQDMGILPDYSLRRSTGGLTLGITAYPFRFHDGSRLGFYLDAYRGSQVYEDFYNLPVYEMPGSSYVKCGITYKFR